MSRLTDITAKLESGFLGFWVRKYRISYLIVLLVLMMGLLSVMSIPKESSPSIKLGMISITTVYLGTNPEDIDKLITDKVYKEIKDIKGVDKITSSSSLGISSIIITTKTSANVKDVMDDVRNAVNKITLPTDAKSPVITEIETNTKTAFSVLVYDPTNNSSRALLIDRAIKLQKVLKTVSGVESIDLSAGGAGGRSASIGGGGSNSTTYDVNIIIPEDKLSALGLTLSSIAGVIRSFNLDQPIGNFALGDKKYDYRIEGKNQKSLDFLDTPITIPGSAQIRLGDIARIERKYKSDAITEVIIGSGGNIYSNVGLTINKSDAGNLFTVSDAAKKEIESVFVKDPEFQNLKFLYISDLADTIRDDYVGLFHEAITTLILVFITMYIFVGFMDSLFATLTLPLAFLSTFILLYSFGYSLNFLTNFSLILSFGIAVDTIIVIVQAASAKVRIGYEPRSAIMLALREYAIPIIAGVSTTIVVFVPMMALPGILGKFLAYIPITIFGVLATGLVLAITVNSALYLLFVRKKTSYVDNVHALEYATDEEKELLSIEREGKIRINEGKAPFRTRMIHRFIEDYKVILTYFLKNTFLRRLSIIVPIILFVLGLVFIAPNVGVEIFPSDDNNVMTYAIEGPVGTRTELMHDMIGELPIYFKGFPEIKQITLSTNGNIVNLTIELQKKALRKSLGQKDVFALEKIWNESLSHLEQKGLKITGGAVKGGPPGGKAVGLKIVSDSSENLPTLIKVAKEFKEYLKTVPGTKNVSVSSQDTPGQFVFRLNKDLLALYGIPASLIYQTISTNMNGITVGSIEDNGDDMNIILKSDRFIQEAKMEDILGISFAVGPTTYKVGNFIDTKVQNAIASVNRENGKVQITVEGDLNLGVDTLSTQASFQKYADAYNFPVGITYKVGGETDSNKELIIAMATAFILALMVIFAILTLMFDSFSQPFIIFYSVFMALPFVMLGLLITNNQFSMPFAIGFIAFTGIAINHGIILIDAININLAKKMEGFTALIEAGSSRLEPMTLTTIATAVGMIPVALKDRFWSGMGWTIIFGIMAASFLTLFVVKGIYYELYIAEHEGVIAKIKRKLRERKGRRVKKED
ncbi:efflux RND transporter permease subunit [Candidatus Gracilibacteria bacterium]|nr:efflux RND transporter permease subunit [Candidatus Gracilibacteria bacterium]